MRNQHINVRTTALAVVLALPVTSAWGAQPGHGETSTGVAEAAIHQEATVVIDEGLTLPELLKRRYCKTRGARLAWICYPSAHLR